MTFPSEPALVNQGPAQEADPRTQVPCAPHRLTPIMAKELCSKRKKCMIRCFKSSLNMWLKQPPGHQEPWTLIMLMHCDRNRYCLHQLCFPEPRVFPQNLHSHASVSKKQQLTPFLQKKKQRPWEVPLGEGTRLLSGRAALRPKAVAPASACSRHAAVWGMPVGTWRNVHKSSTKGRLG